MSEELRIIVQPSDMDDIGIVRVIMGDQEMVFKGNMTIDVPGGWAHGLNSVNWSEIRHATLRLKQIRDILDR